MAITVVLCTIQKNGATWAPMKLLDPIGMNPPGQWFGLQIGLGEKNTFFVASQRNRLHSDRHVLCFCWRLLKVVLTHICIAQHIAQLFTHKIAWFQIPKWGPLCCGYRMLQAWTPLVFTLPGGGEAYSHSPCGIFVTCEVALFMILRACTDAWRTWGAQDKDNTDE